MQMQRYAHSVPNVIPNTSMNVAYYVENTDNEMFVYCECSS